MPGSGTRHDRHHARPATVTVTSRTPATTSPTPATASSAPTGASSAPSTTAASAGPSTTAASATTSRAAGAPAGDPLAGAVLTTAGLGPIKLDLTADAAIATGLVERRKAEAATNCTVLWTIQEVQNKGVQVTSLDDRITSVSVKSANFATPSGVKVGMTPAELLQRVPNAVEGVAGGQRAYTLRDGNHAMVFFFDKTSIIQMAAVSGLSESGNIPMTNC